MNIAKESFIKKCARWVAFTAVNLAATLLCSKPSKPRSIENPSQILVIELAMLGDLLISSPLYYSIRKNFPNANITIVCTPWSKNAIEHGNYADTIFLYEAFWEDRSTQSRPAWKHAQPTIRLLKMFRSNKFDLCFAVASRKQPFIPLIAYLSGAKFRMVPVMDF